MVKKTEADSTVSPTFDYHQQGVGYPGYHPFFTTSNPYVSTGINPYQSAQIRNIIPYPLSYDLFEEGDHLILEIPFPGLSKDKLTVIQENRWIRVVGETEPACEPSSGKTSQKVLLVSQNPRGVFDQLIVLPSEVDQLKASYTNGVIIIRMKKALGKDAHRVPVEFK